MATTPLIQDMPPHTPARAPATPVVSVKTIFREVMVPMPKEAAPMAEKN